MMWTDERLATVCLSVRETGKVGGHMGACMRVRVASCTAKPHYDGAMCLDLN